MFGHIEVGIMNVAIWGVGHQEYFLQHLCETKECLDDEKLEKFVTKLEKKNQDLVSKFYGLL